METPRLPRPDPQQAALGRRLYDDLSPHQLWFLKGTPHEWVRALEMNEQCLQQLYGESQCPLTHTYRWKVQQWFCHLRTWLRGTWLKRLWEYAKYYSIHSH